MGDFVVTSYDQAEKLLRRNDLRQALYDAGAILMKDVLVNLHGDAHRARRTAEARAFRRDFFKYYEREVFPVTLDQTLRPYLQRGKADVCDFGYNVMLNLTADSTGLDRPERTPEETTALLGILRTLGKAPTLGQTLEQDKEAIRQEIRAALDLFGERFYRPSRRRREALLATRDRGEIEDTELPRDVMTMILDNPQTAAEPDEVMLKEMAFFLLAGAFTSIHSMTHAVHRILEWFDAHPQDEARLRGNMHFLQRVAYETSRLHPSSPVTRRRPLEEVEIEGLGHIRPEDTITVDLLSVNKDTVRFGADAAEFNPWRDTGTQPLYGLSFGTGIHACIGRQLALGVLPRPGAENDEDRQYGTIPLVLHALMTNNARRDPADEPRMDVKSGRPNWACYPVLLG
jgi:cytochrome P450